ncbi:MarR family winged helix-turn-helix transcriptional regulator [Paenibacillus sp. R14(2021)]|uniref:MarR family winged helix-turn-helix transcriptional regulator n=1 Tax=Paenibacillus sp. R14(2021) TaxID=2859228 RepID=UPI001C613729|nr:MarR family transcriptional regulator [Paenibacillus sp. R14(2021)]
MTDTPNKTYSERFQTAISVTNRKIGMLVSQSLEDGLTGPQCYLMKLIREEERPTASMLAERMEVKPSAITVMLDRLVQHGFVSRIPDEHDRRVMLLKLTDKGDVAFGKVRQTYTSILDHLLQTLEQSEAEAFILTFERITNAVTQMDDIPNSNKN